MGDVIEIKGLDELIKRMQAYPEQLKKSVTLTMQAALLALWENVPPYPPPPETSTYDRTGTLGRTLGSSVDGGRGGQPSIYEVREQGSVWEGHFGTNLEYAPYVIDPEQQAGHMKHWWVITAIKDKAQAKIESLFATLGEKLAAFLEGK